MPMFDVTSSVFKMMFSPAREHVFLNICVLVHTKKHFPILVVFVSCKLY